MSGVKSSQTLNDLFDGLVNSGVKSDSRLPLGAVDFSLIDVLAGNTDGGVIKAGTSSAPVTEDTANMKFVSMYFDDGATSGEAVGIYDRLYVTGAGGEGIALRAFCTVSDVAAGNARGAHVSLSFGASGTVTGLGAALEATLHLPTTAGATGTITAINAAINSDGDNSDPAGATSLSAFRVSNQGGNGKADVDDDCCLFDFSGWTAGANHMIGALDGNEPTWAGKTCLIKVRLPSGALAYLVAVSV